MTNGAVEREDVILEFKNNLMGQLKKNGFPEKAVAFPVDALFEAASKKGFSFNRVRALLETDGVDVEIAETRVIFRSAQSGTPYSQEAAAVGASHAGFEQIAADLLTKISPEQMQQFKDIVGRLSADERVSLQKEFESMDDGQKRELMLKMKGLFGS